MSLPIMHASRASLSLLGLSSTVLSSTISICRPSIPIVYPQCSASYSSSPPSNAPSFSYRLAASFSGKDTYYKPYSSDTYTFSPSRPSHKRYNHRKQNLRANSGQDAFFITSAGSPDSKAVAFGLADGVGGWTESGVDPADFSHGLCHYISSLAESATSPANLQPAELLDEAYTTVLQDPRIHAGGSTACLAVGHPNGILSVANLGDSGFVHLRPGKVFYASEAQTHAFNTPYQLSKIPPAMAARSRNFGGEMLRDGPQDAETTTHTVKHGDILIFGSDGVWDNLSPADVLAVTSKWMTTFEAWKNKDSEAGSNPAFTIANRTLLDGLTTDNGIPTKERNLQAALAIAVAGEAKVASLDRKRNGPFAQELKRYYPEEDWEGGKVDDICVVVAVVVGDEAGQEVSEQQEVLKAKL